VNLRCGADGCGVQRAPANRRQSRLPRPLSPRHGRPAAGRGRPSTGRTTHVAATAQSWSGNARWAPRRLRVDRKTAGEYSSSRDSHRVDQKRTAESVFTVDNSWYY